MEGALEGIDPRLRDAAPPHYEQPQRPSTSYNGVTGAGTSASAGEGAGAGLDSLSQPSATPTSQTHQHHQYFGVPTPASYSSGAHQDASGSPYDNHGPQNPSDPHDLKRPRACEACRQLKVRCELDDNSPTGSCRRCAKAARQCVITAPSRKRQKKTDSRVAELEKKIDALTATLHAQRGIEPGDHSIDPAIAQTQIAELEQQRGELHHQSPWQEPVKDSLGHRQSNHISSPMSAEGLTGSKRKFTNEILAYAGTAEAAEQERRRRTTMPDPPNFPSIFHGRPSSIKDTNDNPYLDVIDRQVVDAQTAYHMFHRYQTEMLYLPIVVFTPGTKAEDIRRTKPALFLAILSAACNTIRPDLQPVLMTEIMRVLADRIVCRGEKSMELIQSLQVVTVFYQPPEKYEELNFNQLIHIGVVMGIDIGMGKRSRSGQVGQWQDNPSKLSQPDANAAEIRRAWLGLYFICANAAMSLRRPLLVRWSPYTEESLEVLAKAADALPSDRWLAHIVRAQHIAEEVGYQFSMDDPPSDVSITQPKVQYQIKTFEKQLDEWRRDSPEDMPQSLLKHNEAIIDLYIHEIAMHHAHNIDDFRPPYGVVEESDEPPDYITPAHIDSLTICLASIHRTFDAILEMSLSALRSLPTLIFVRNSYAAVALVKMYSAVSAKGSKFGSVFRPNDLKVEHYLDALIEKLRRANDGGQGRVAAKFIIILSMLRNWQVKRASGGATQPEKGMIGAKNVNVGWEKQPQPQQLAGQNPQNPKTASWSAATAAVDAISSVNTPNKPQHAGLQMLSEAAMNNNSNHDFNEPSGPAVAISSVPPANHSSRHPLTTTTNPPWDAQLAAYANMQSQAPQPHSSMALDTSFVPAGGSDLDAGFALTDEEWGALGNMMDDPGWVNFGLESVGWAM